MLSKGLHIWNTKIRPQTLNSLLSQYCFRNFFKLEGVITEKVFNEFNLLTKTKFLPLKYYKPS